MVTKKSMASTASKRAKRVTIIAMAAIAGASVSQAEAAARAAICDMKNDMGLDATVLAYTWDPFDGFCA